MSDPLEQAKLILARFTPEEQRELRLFLGRRLGLESKPASAVVATVKRRGAQGSVTYRKELVRCGKASCKCVEKPCHGPYTYKYWREDGKLKKEYKGKAGWAGRA